MTGIFVVFEGGDGVGKSTQCRLLAESLEAAGFAVVQTLQPGGTKFGASLRKILLDPATGDISERAEALLYAADKAQHIQEVVLPALAAGAIVISDRYVDSMLAYQGAGRALDAVELKKLADWATGGLVADLTVLLDLSPIEGLQGIWEQDRLEAAGTEFHTRVRQGFLELANANSEHYLVIPARLPVAEIALQVRDRVSAILAR